MGEKNSNTTLKDFGLIILLLVVIMFGCSSKTGETAEKSEPINEEQTNKIQDDKEEKQYVEGQNEVEKKELTPAELNHLEWLFSIIDRYEESVGNIQKLFSVRLVDLSLSEKNDWHQYLRVYCADIKMSYAHLIEASNSENVPESMVEIHTILEEGFNAISTAGFNIADGIESGIENGIYPETIEDELFQMNASQDEINKVIKTIKENYNLEEVKSRIRQ